MGGEVQGVGSASRVEAGRRGGSPVVLIGGKGTGGILMTGCRGTPAIEWLRREMQ